MPAATSPFFGINYGWTTGENSWGDPVNANFKALSFLGKGAVDSFVASLPVSPSDGDSVVLTTDNQFYVRLEGAWLFIQPQDGQEVNETSTGKRWQFNGSWVEIASAESLKVRVEVLEQFDVDLGDPTSGAGMVGTKWDVVGAVPTTLQGYLNAFGEVPFELLGGVGDYDPIGDTGTDNATAFAVAREAGILGARIRFKSGANYKTTGEIIAHSDMNWVGDDGYTPSIYGVFLVGGKRIVKSPTTGPKLQNVSMSGISFFRWGIHAEHGILLDNIDGLFLDVKVDGVSTALGGALGVSPFYPENRPSTNCHVKLKCNNGGNFGLQFGNVDGGSMQVFAKNCMREVLGVEPYTLGKFDFVQANVTADAITLTAHGLTTGYPLIYSKQLNTAIAALTRANYYFAIVIDANTIKLADTKEDAIAGVALTLAAFTGTHRLYKCGISRDIEVLPSTIDVGDIPASGSATGLVILSASSGGYHENIRVRSVDTIERNPTSGSFGFSVYGAQNVSVENCSSVGSKLGSVFVTRGFLQGVSDSTGNIDPAIGLELLPAARIKNVIGTQFSGTGGNCDFGLGIFDGCSFLSNVSGVTGLKLSAAAESLGSFARRNDVKCPSGTALNLIKGDKNRDLNDAHDLTREYFSKRFDRGTLYKSLTGAGGAITVASVSSQLAAATTYMGKVTIHAMQLDTDNTNRARYDVAIKKAFNGDTAAAALLNSQGLIAGGGATHPSFTWSMSGNDLLATPVGSTSTTGSWVFFLEWDGDVRLV